MNDKEKIAALREKLRIATGIHELFVSQPFQEFLYPYLERLSQVDPIRPSDYKTKDEFLFALENMNMEAGVYQQLLKFLKDQKNIMTRIQEQIEKPVTTYEL